MGSFFFGIMEMALRNPFGLPLKKKNCLSPESLIKIYCCKIGTSFFLLGKPIRILAISMMP